MRSRIAPNINAVLRFVCGQYQVTQSALLGRNRAHPLGEARAIAYYLARREGLSLPKIGAAFGRDHTSIFSGIRTAKKVMSREPVVANMVAAYVTQASCAGHGEGCEQVRESLCTATRNYANTGCVDLNMATPVDYVVVSEVDSWASREAAE